MKPSFLFIACLMISGLFFMSMTDRIPVLSTVIDNVAVTDLSTSVVTTYEIERSTGGNGGPTGSVTINGTRTEPPTPNQDGGYNYRCTKSQEICYQCDDCEIQSVGGGD